MNWLPWFVDPILHFVIDLIQRNNYFTIEVNNTQYGSFYGTIVKSIGFSFVSQ